MLKNHENRMKGKTVANSQSKTFEFQRTFRSQALNFTRATVSLIWQQYGCLVDQHVCICLFFRLLHPGNAEQWGETASQWFYRACLIVQVQHRIALNGTRMQNKKWKFAFEKLKVTSLTGNSLSLRICVLIEIQKLNTRLSNGTMHWYTRCTAQAPYHTLDRFSSFSYINNPKRF